VHDTDRQGRTILHQVCGNFFQDNSGSSPRVPLYSPLTDQQIRESVRVEVLLKAGADAQKLDSEGNTPLHLACRWGNVPAVELVAQRDVFLKENNQGKTPIDLAKEIVDMTKCFSVMRLLEKVSHTAAKARSPCPPSTLGACLSVETQSDAESSDSSQARIHGDGMSVSIDSQAEAETLGFPQHRGMLHLVDVKDTASISGGEEVEADAWSTHRISKMLDSKVLHFSKADSQGVFPLQLACRHGNTHITERLLQAGADVKEHDVTGRTVLHDVSERGDLAILDLLLQHCCDVTKTVNQADRQGRTPLH
jgi:ankyrin repeat protein